MTVSIDTSTDYGKRVLERLQSEIIIWITTTSQDNTPQPNPSWFLWENDGFLIFSKPDAVKLQHIQRNPRVGLNLESGVDGEDIVIFTGNASVESGPASESSLADYFDKYRELLPPLGWTEATYAELFTVVIRVDPTKLRGW